MERLDKETDSKLNLAKQRRNDRIVELQEALRIAQSLDVELGGVNSSTFRSQEGIAVNTAEIPLYMRGVKALRAEIETIKARQSDAPFIKGLRDLQERLAYLKDIEINKQRLVAAIVDQRATTPSKPAKPKRRLIIMLAFVAGVLLGILGALLAEFVASVRQQPVESIP